MRALMLVAAIAACSPRYPVVLHESSAIDAELDAHRGEARFLALLSPT